MPVVKKKAGAKKSFKKKSGSSSTRKRSNAKKVDVSLPTEKSTPMEAVGDYSILLYGVEKIGKTSLASHFPDAFMLMFEPGGKALSIYQKPVHNWEELLAYIELLEAGDHSFNTVGIDTVDIAYEYCMDYICRKLVIDHPSDEAYGKGWKALRDEFTKTMIRLLNCSGCLFLSHSTEKEIKQRSGETSHRIIPTMAKQAREILEGLVDIIAYYHYDDDGNRILQVRGDELVTAGVRPEKAFSGVQNIPMGESSKEAYDNFVAAFRNEKVESSNGSASAAPRKRAVRKRKK